MEFMEAMAWQAIGQINMLQDGFDDDGRPVNCCPICCGPCFALNVMISDPSMANQLSEAIQLTGYHVDGWDYWSQLSDMLHVGDIKAMWFNADGSHKAICMSSDGVDESDVVHRAILADIAWRGSSRKVTLDAT
jgi:hypothetical protein